MLPNTASTSIRPSMSESNINNCPNNLGKFANGIHVTTEEAQNTWVALFTPRPKHNLKSSLRCVPALRFQTS